VLWDLSVQENKKRLVFFLPFKPPSPEMHVKKHDIWVFRKLLILLRRLTFPFLGKKKENDKGVLGDKNGDSVQLGRVLPTFAHVVNTSWISECWPN
jgi:hypothetical protein